MKINGIYYDGDYSVASAVGGVEIETPFENQPPTLIFRQKFQQWGFHPLSGAPIWQPLDANTSPAAGGMTPPVPFNNNPKSGRGPFLVKETARKDIGAGIWEWERVWAHVPYVIYHFPGMDYQRQVYSMTVIPWTGQWDQWGNFHGTYRTFTAIEEWSEPLTATIERKFVCIPSKKYNPTQIRKMCQIQTPFRIVKYNDERGKEHVFQMGAQGVASPTEIEPWMGDILEVRNTFVTPANMGGSSSGAGGGSGYHSNVPAWPYLNDSWQPIYL